MEESSGPSSSFTNPVYRRYWQHYQEAMGWYQRHRQAYRKAVEAAYGPWYYQHLDSSRRYPEWHGGEGWGGPRKRARVEEVDSSSDSDIECDVSNMEITDELRQFFAQTEKHREELKKQQQMEAEEHESYVPADRDIRRASWRSAAPPSERPGARRAAVMKELYGEAAAQIQGMETAMQLTFDRNCDRKQPKYWPVIPLKL